MVEWNENTTPKVPVIWLVHAVRLGKRGECYMSLGFCGKTRKVAFIGVIKPDAPITDETLKTLIVKDIWVDETCEDASWCWNLECPLNEASLKHFGKYLGKKAGVEDLKKTAKKIQEMGSHLVDQIDDWSKPVTLVYEKPLLVITLSRGARATKG